MLNLYPEPAWGVAVGRLENDSNWGLTFMRVYPDPSIELASDNHIVTVRVNKKGLGKLFLALQEAIKANPQEFGFKPIARDQRGEFLEWKGDEIK